MPKKATPPSKPFKARGWLVCDTCAVTVEYHSLGEGPTADGGWPLHRCGYDVRPFTTWTADDPKPPINKPQPEET
jgi:hypothetical protein